MASADRRCLGIFAKWPQADAVKTRLAAAASPEWAAAVARAFLLDTLARFFPIPAHHIIAFAPAEAKPWFADLADSNYALAPQTTGDLGQRLEAFCHSQLQAGMDKVVVLGTDSPTMPVEFVERAFIALDGADVVLGPATDGGYYLIGIARRLPPIFANIAWSTSAVLAQTVAALREPDWRLALLPPWYDVDTPQDWDLLTGHIAALRRAGIDIAVPHTEKILQSPVF